MEAHIPRRKPQKSRTFGSSCAVIALVLCLGACTTIPTPVHDDLGDGPVIHSNVHVDSHTALHVLDFVGHVLEAVFWIHAIRHGGYYDRRHRH